MLAFASPQMPCIFKAVDKLVINDQMAARTHYFPGPGTSHGLIDSILTTTIWGNWSPRVSKACSIPPRQLGGKRGFSPRTPHPLPDCLCFSKRKPWVASQSCLSHLSQYRTGALGQRMLWALRVENLSPKISSIFKWGVWWEEAPPSG